jgi:ABC-2 type transport system permease protein
VFPVVQGLFSATATLTWGVVVFGLDLDWPSALLGLPVALFSMVAFAPFGLALLAVTLIVKRATLGTAWLLAGISFVSGFYFPVSLLPQWIRWLSDVQPFAPSVDLLRHVLVGSSLNDSLAADLLRMAGSGLVLTPLALLGLRTAIRTACRTGSIVES